MALLSVIRRWAFRDQLSIREISRRIVAEHDPQISARRLGGAKVQGSKLDAFADTSCRDG